MEDFENEYDDSPVLDPNIRKQLREAEKVAKEAAEAKKQLLELQKEMAFTKAGIPETGAGALLRKAYEGELTAEAIRKQAEEYQIFAPSHQAATEPQNSIPESELEGMRRVAGAAAGAGGTPPVNVEMALNTALAGANSESEVMAVVTQFYRENPDIGFFPKGAFN